MKTYTKSVKKSKSLNTNSVRINVLKFNLKRILIEEQRGKCKDLQFYFDSIKKEFGDNIQQMRMINFNFNKPPNMFNRRVIKFTDYNLTHKGFSKEKVHALVNDIWIDPINQDKIRVVGISYEERKIYFKDYRNCKTNILQSLNAKEFRNKYQLFCVVIDSVWENFI